MVGTILSNANAICSRPVSHLHLSAQLSHNKVRKIPQIKWRLTDDALNVGTTVRTTLVKFAGSTVNAPGGKLVTMYNAQMKPAMKPITELSLDSIDETGRRSEIVERRDSR